jgi:hypothetical protein
MPNSESTGERGAEERTGLAGTAHAPFCCIPACLVLTFIFILIFATRAFFGTRLRVCFRLGVRYGGRVGAARLHFLLGRRAGEIIVPLLIKEAKKRFPPSGGAIFLGMRVSG